MVRLKYIIWGAKVITSKIWGPWPPWSPGSYAYELCHMGAMKFAALITCYISNTHTQCLIEMCAGNFTNQYVALDGQVLDSINRILGILCTEKFVRELSL